VTLYVHRSRRTEVLLEGLASLVRAAAPLDPFEELPIVVGSRGMERWLRHELATELDAAVGLAFPMVGAAFDATLRWLVGGGASDPHRGAFWERPSLASEGAWAGETFVRRVRRELRASLGEPELHQVARYLADAHADRERPVDAREEQFARAVAEVLARLLHDRPLESLAWRRGEDVPTEHAWLARLLARLHASTDEPSPAVLVEAALALPARRSEAAHTVAVFGLSTLRPGDKLRIALVARHVDVHLYALTPSSEWWSDVKGRREAVRALARAKDDAARRELLAELAQQNPLLAANGIPSRDLQLWVEEIGGVDLDPPEPREAEAPSLLARLQRWLDGAQPPPEAGSWAGPSPCDSVQLHATHGPLRACEALRDELLSRFAKDASLEPRHVVVMTPDLATYAPLVAAVFQRGGRSANGRALPSIPVSIADLGLRSTNPVADVLARVLELAADRVSAPALYALLSLAPVRARFGFEEHELPRLERLLEASAMRWGWDADDRRTHGFEGEAHHTIAFGLERLALGLLMPDPGGIDVIASPLEVGPPLVPVELVGREDAASFGRLAEACAHLEAARASLTKPATLGEWRARLGRAMRELTRSEDELAWQEVEVERTLDELFVDEGEGGLRYDPSAVTALVAGAFDSPERGPRAHGSAVTVCALEPMRSVPFRVVVLLGMNDGVFPRSGRVPDWSPFATPRFAEYDRRAIDRHMALEALLSARDALLVYGTGFEPKQGERIALSTVVSELGELVAHATGREGSFECTHPLHPWSERAFEPGAPPVFDGSWAEAASRMRRGESSTRRAGLESSSLVREWPPEFAPDTLALSAERLARALENPARELLEKVLGLPGQGHVVELADREPIELDRRGANALVRRALPLESEHVPFGEARLVERLRAEGCLPPGGLGEREVRDAHEQARRAVAYVDGLEGVAGEGARFACEVETPRGARVVTASAPATRVHPDGVWLVWTLASKAPGDRERLVAWITLLVAALDPATATPPRGAILCGCSDEVSKAKLGLEAPGEPAARLLDLLAVYDELRRGPIPLFTCVSSQVAEKALRSKTPPGPEEAVSLALESAWTSDAPGSSRRALEDEWTAELYGTLTEDDLMADFGRLYTYAERVWGPLEVARRTSSKIFKAGSGTAPQKPSGPSSRKGSS